MLRSRKPLVLLLVTFLLLSSNGRVLAQSAYFSKWPAGTSPREVGKRVAVNFAARQFEFAQAKRQYVIYPEACAWYGSLTVAQMSKEKDLKARLLHKFDPLFTPEGAKAISPEPHVDYRVFGIVPLEIYMQTKDPKFLQVGQSLADKQWDKTAPNGITRK